MQIKDALTVCFHYSWRKLSFNFRECLDFRFFRDIVLLRTVRAATSTYGDTYYDKRGKTDGAQVTLPGAAGDNDTDADCSCDPSKQKSDI